jgi:hypothetical protein
MSQVREIKCPHCGKWTLWNGQTDDRCLYCSEFIEPKRLPKEVEQKIGKEVAREKDYFFIKPGDGKIKREIKLFLNSLRWLVYYFQIAFFSFISLLLLLLSLFSG